MPTHMTPHSAADLQVLRANRADQLPLRQMVELYLHDFSEFDGDDLDEHGLFGHSSLDYFWHEPAHFAYVFRVNGRYAGFALLNDDVCDPENQFWMAEFFVLRKYRKAGIGRAAAARIFDAHRGRWEVGQRSENEPSRAFWRSVIAAHTGGQYREIALDDDAWRGTVQVFDNSATGAGLGPTPGGRQVDPR